MLRATLNKVLLQTLLDKFIKKELGMAAPSVASAHTLIYEEGEGLEEDEAAHYVRSLSRSLAELKLESKDVLSIEAHLALTIRCRTTCRTCVSKFS